MTYLKVIKAITPSFLKYFYRKLRTMRRQMTYPYTAVANVRNVVVKIGVCSEVEYYRVETYATKEPETLDWLDDNLRCGDVFLDVGANIGLYSIYAGSIQPDCRIYAFEPAFQNYNRLCSNIILNGLNNVIPCNFPLSENESFDYFYVTDVQPGSALHAFGESNHASSELKTVPLRQGSFSLSLDALVRRYGMPQPTLVKVDVDGLEEKILDGAQETLQSDEMRTVLVEWNYRDKEDIDRFVKKMAGWGYSLSGISAWLAEQDAVKGQNFIFHR
jgi:FkbM family methyltransferase